MKTRLLGLAVLGLLVGCSKPTAENEARGAAPSAATPAAAGSSQPSRSTAAATKDRAEAPLTGTGLRQTPGPVAPSAVLTLSTDDTPAGRLKRPIELAHDRISLEEALEEVGRQIGLPIVIRGPDLESENITPNQSFRLHEPLQPAAALLERLLWRADVDDRLVFVIHKHPDGRDELIVTTRAAAARRREKIPEIFTRAQAPSRPIAASSPTTPAGGTAAVRLKRPISLSFERNSLDFALQLAAHEIGLPIVIRGPDLQLEGITKNQSIRLDEPQRPAEEVLAIMLRRANIDDKLIYVIHSAAGGGEELIVTTRAAAAKRGDIVPDVFQRTNP